MEPNTLIQAFIETAARHPERPALLAKQEGRYSSIPYSAAAERVRRVGAGLVALGVGAGDRVAIFSENRPEWALADLGTYMAGAVVVPLYATLPPAQAEVILRDSGASVLVVAEAKRVAAVQRLRESLPDLQHIVAVGAPAPAGGLTLGALMELGAAPELQAECDRRIAGLGRDSLATIVYTSGTTGEPKGAMLTHGNILANLRAVDPRLSPTHEDIFLSFLPLSHIFERTCGHYLALWRGACIAYAESLFSVAKNMEEVRPTVMMSVPRLYENMQARILDTVSKARPLQRRLFEWALETGQARMARRMAGKRVPALLAVRYALADRLVLRRVRQRTGGRIRYFCSGGAPLPPDTARFIYALGFPLLQGYGLTETSPVIATTPPDQPRAEGVGTIVDGVEAKLAEDGEILSRGPCIMQGYWKKPEETAAAIDAEGWFHTGDIGEFTHEGHLLITDRKKNILVLSNGKNVAPQPIEARLKTSPFIAEALLVGDQRAALGALIVPDFEALRGRDGLAGLEKSELAAHSGVRHLLRAEIDRLSEDLAPFERVKRFAILPRELTIDAAELTPTLKPRRDVVFSHFAEEVAGV